MREWSYWTRNKLTILSDYLPVFTRAASTKVPRGTLYLDLMAGEPVNVARETGDQFDGSARIAIGCKPPFGKVVLFEKHPSKAAALLADIEERFPGDARAQVVVGDCNSAVASILRGLRAEGWDWAPTFVFLDQQVAEIAWSTLHSLSTFRRTQTKTKAKAELWMLLSPTMFNRSIGSRSNPNESSMAAVTRMFGTDDWLRIYRAQEVGVISAEEARRQWTNLMRWRLQNRLGYRYTESILMRMPQGPEIYEMVFATDHPVGDKVMTYLYRKAAEREPKLMAESVAVRLNRKAEEGQGLLIPYDGDDLLEFDERWVPTSVHDPASVPWWDTV